ncbi:hypothetical protein B0H19DRAFT_1099926 [Mycena capillaripes]|nr:hypothetical protein B0H19DRAFT_1099926 [Mycena capillaripes]
MEDQKLEVKSDHQMNGFTVHKAEVQADIFVGTGNPLTALDSSDVHAAIVMGEANIRTGRREVNGK